jgi:RNA polymerase sigma factor (sigma-70 family)
VHTAPIPAQVTLAPLRSKRLLALATDGTLVEQMRRGNEAAFSVVFERYVAGLVRFCRHMLGSPEEAEDAVQHTFVAAFRDLARPDERELALKPWLYAIARNRCLSMLRTRREQTALDFDFPTEGLTAQVERRAELRDVLRDLLELPEDQRAALLLSEAGDLSHADVAGVLGCEVANVKALVFRARNGLIQRREARETACADIREQLANLRGSSLRRNGLRHHLRSCAGCRAYRDQVRAQRRTLAAALPVVPSGGLRSSVLGAIGGGGGSAGGGLAAGGGAGLSASLGAGTLTKVAALGVLAGGVVAGGEALVDDAGRTPEASTRSVARGPAPLRAPSGVPIGPKQAITRGVRPSEPRFVDRGTGPHTAEPRSGPAPGPADGPRSSERDHSASAPLPDAVAPKSGQTHGHDDRAATLSPEPRSGGPVAEPPAGSPEKGGPPAGTPNKGGPPTNTPGYRGPPGRAPGERDPPASAPAERGLPAGAPVQHGSGEPIPHPERQANPPAPESAPVAAPNAAPSPQPPTGPPDHAYGHRTDPGPGAGREGPAG